MTEQETKAPTKLAEIYQVDQSVQLCGELTVPGDKSISPEALTISHSSVRYFAKFVLVNGNVTSNEFGDPMGTQKQQMRLKRLLPDLPETTRLGVIIFIQRFGSRLILHIHCHICVIDGRLYTDDSQDVHYAPIENFGVEDSLAIQNRVLNLFNVKSYFQSDRKANATFFANHSSNCTNIFKAWRTRAH